MIHGGGVLLSLICAENSCADSGGFCLLQERHYQSIMELGRRSSSFVMTSSLVLGFQWSVHSLPKGS